MNIAHPLPAPEGSPSVPRARSRAALVGLAFGLALALAGLAILVWPDSAVMQETRPAAVEAPAAAEAPLEPEAPLEAEVVLGQDVVQEPAPSADPATVAESAASLPIGSTGSAEPPADVVPLDRTESAQAEPAAAPAEPVAEALPPSGTAEVAPIAIMVENARDARPHSGLVAADVVFEALAEGGISRFMAVYFGGEATVVGPVRSARHYFVNLAAEFGASLVHIGSSPQGYHSLQWHGLRNLDETHGHAGFWRSNRRWAPHNAYTSVADVRAALEARGAAPSGSWGGFTFKEPARYYSGPATPVVSIEYQPWNYRVQYRHDPGSNRYARFMEGAAHRDADSGVQIEAANVAVLQLQAWVIDDEGRLDMGQIGSGPAVFFLDGVAIEGRWHKGAPGEVTRLTDLTGLPVRFNPGPIWVQLITTEGKVYF